MAMRAESRAKVKLRGGAAAKVKGACGGLGPQRTLKVCSMKTPVTTMIPIWRPAPAMVIVRADVILVSVLPSRLTRKA